MADDNKSVVPVTFDASCVTKIRTEKFKYRWSIENFTQCRSDYLMSSVFSMGEAKQVSWVHRLWPNKNGIVKLETIIKSLNESAPLYGRMKVKVMGPERSLVRNEFSASGLLKATSYLGNDWFMINRTELIAEQNGFLKNKTLELYFEMTVTESLPCHGGNAQIAIPEPQLATNVGSLFDDKKYSDVTIAVGLEEFFCHKAILAVRSPVFAAMFEHQMVESRENRIVVTDIEPKVFRELLRFIYTDQVQDLDKMAVDLLPVADKYAIDRLKALCEQHLCNNLSEGTALETLILADDHNSEQLKRQSIAFINSSGADFSTDLWKSTCAKRSRLVSEILDVRAKK